MIIKAKNLKTGQEISCAIDCALPADVAFQNILAFDTPLHSPDYKNIVLIIPFCKNSDEIRARSKPYRSKYGVDKVFFMDIDETYLVHKKLNLPFGELAPTIELVKIYLENQGFQIITNV